MTRARVLIVEDEAVLLLGLEDRLMALGHEVVGTADCAADAVARADALRPELVLMDVRLRGEVDGITAADEIRRRFAIPSIFLTAFADERTVARATIAEPLAYLHKPVQDAELRTAVEIGLYRHRVERERREREGRYAATLDAISDAVVVTDAAGAVVRLNPAAELLTGWPDADARGVPVDEVVPLYNADAPGRADHPALAALGRADPLPPDTATVLVTRAGTEIRVETVASEIRPVADEPPTGAVLTVRDVTGRDRTERERRQRERRAAVVALAAGTAHGFAEVLTPAVGFAALLREAVHSNPKLRDMAARVEDRLAAGNERVRQLHAVAGMGRPRARVEVRPLLDRATTEYTARLPPGVSLRLGAPDGPLAVSGDDELLHRLFRILITNAVEAVGAAGAVTVTVGVEECAAGAFAGCRGFDDPRSGRYLCVAVADTGPGIPAVVTERLFVPFASTKGHGRGLGLVMAEGIVTAHRGAIRLDGERPGARARVWLPLAN